MTYEEAVQAYEADYDRKLRNLASQALRDLADVAKFAAVREQLKALWPHYREPVSWFGYQHAIIQVTKEQLPELRQIFGKLEKSHVTGHDLGKRIVSVWLKNELLPEARFYYLTELEDDMPCKIIEQPVEKPMLSLVCEVPDAVQPQ